MYRGELLLMWATPESNRYDGALFTFESTKVLHLSKSSSWLLGVAGGLLRAAERREAALNPKPYPKSERFGGDPKTEGGRASPSARLRARAREVPHAVL